MNIHRAAAAVDSVLTADLSWPELTEAARAAFTSIDVEDLAASIWEASRADEGTISATGAKIVAQAVKAHLLREA